MNCKQFKTNTGKKCPNCCSEQDECKWIKGKGCSKKIIRDELESYSQLEEDERYLGNDELGSYSQLEEDERYLGNDELESYSQLEEDERYLEKGKILDQQNKAGVYDNFYDVYMKKYFSNKKNLIDKELPRPINQRNVKDTVKFVAVHGGLNGNTFILPPNTQIITLTKPGEIFYVTKMTLDIVIDIYDNGGTLFENNDKSNVLTKEGKLFKQLV